MSSSIKVIRGSFLDFVDDPFYQSESDSVRYLSDGLLAIEDDKIIALGTYESLKEQYANYEIVSYQDKLITPGLIDLHVHYPQTEIIAAYGEQLMQWLDRYVFPTEAKFEDAESLSHYCLFFSRRTVTQWYNNCCSFNYYLSAVSRSFVF